MNSVKFAPWLMSLVVLAATPAVATNYVVQVAVGGPFFTPKTLTINVGDSVTWHHVNGDHPSNVVATDKSFRCAEGCDGQGGNGNPNGGEWSFTLTFTTPGIVNYYCEEGLANGMTGKITVNASAATVIGPGFTGAWYDPAQSGHGLFLEVLPNNALLAWWFTFSPSGAQSWFGGVGSYTGNTATANISQVLQTTGGKWIPNFDPSKTTNIPWGTLTFTFTDCNSGRVDFNSSVPGYGVGSMNLTRLTLPAGLTCP